MGNTNVCGTCNEPTPLTVEIRCALAPDHETAHRSGAWSWDNRLTGAKAEDEPRMWVEPTGGR